MRVSNLNAYLLFTAHIGEKFTPQQVLTALGTSTPTAGGGAAGHVSHLRTVNGLNILSEKAGREVLHYWLSPEGYTFDETTGKYVTPPLHAEVAEHYERIAKIKANKEARATKLTPEQKAANRAARKAAEDAIMASNPEDAIMAAINAATMATEADANLAAPAGTGDALGELIAPDTTIGAEPSGDVPSELAGDPVIETVIAETPVEVAPTKKRNRSKKNKTAETVAA